MTAGHKRQQELAAVAGPNNPLQRDAGIVGLKGLLDQRIHVIRLAAVVVGEPLHLHRLRHSGLLGLFFRHLLLGHLIARGRGGRLAASPEHDTAEGNCAYTTQQVSPRESFPDIHFTSSLFEVSRKAIA